MAILFQTETAELIRGDSLSLLESVAPGSADAVVTDPPYSSGGMVRGDRMADPIEKYVQGGNSAGRHSFSGDNRDQRSFAHWCALWLAAARSATAVGGMLCVFTDWRQLPAVTDAVQAGGWVWRGVVAWDKRSARPVARRFRQSAEFVVWGTNGPRSMEPGEGDEYGDGVFSISPPRDRLHMTEKPVRLLRDLIRVASDPGGLVLDPFAGSGSTGVAAIKEGRRFLGFEMDERMSDLARKRIEEAA